MMESIVLAVLMAAIQVEVKTTDGPVVAGELVEATAEQVVVRSSERVELPAARILSVHVKSAGPDAISQPNVWVELVDGGKLSGKSFTVQDGVAQLELAAGGRARLPTRDIRWVRLEPLPHDRAKSWHSAVAANTSADRLAVVKAAGVIDVLEGVLRDVTVDTVHFEMDGEIVRVKRAKAFGLIYQRLAERKLDDAVCVVETVAGDRLEVKNFKMVGDRLSLTNRSGLNLEFPWSAVRKIDFAATKLTYLSDLAPERVTWAPLVGPAGNLAELARLYEPRRDQALLGGPLAVWQADTEGRLGRARFEKGLSLHSRSEVVYRLPTTFRELLAHAGIDPRVRDGGHVKLVVMGDEKRLFETALARGEAAKNLRIDLKGVNRLTILVDYGQDLDVGDYVNLGDARLMK